jgi:Flp pilus assembly protein TadB
MSRERARAREARLAESARRAADARARAQQQARRRQRRERRTEAVRGVLPRRARRWSRRTRGQRASTVLVLAGIGLFAYLLVDSWSVRIAVMLIALLAAPAVLTMLLDRSTR